MLLWLMNMGFAGGGDAVVTSDGKTGMMFMGEIQQITDKPIMDSSMGLF